jgi:hypothetical protein
MGELLMGQQQPAQWQPDSRMDSRAGLAGCAAALLR